MRSFSIIVAVDEKNGIGKNATLAWRLPADLKHFKEISTFTEDPNKRNALIMGRKTWDSLPEKFKPLPGRLNVILSHNKITTNQAESFTGFDLALESLSLRKNIEKIFVIGGAQIYAQVLLYPDCQSLYITRLKGDFNCDVFFPPIPPAFKEFQSSSWLNDGPIEYSFIEYRRA